MKKLAVIGNHDRPEVRAVFESICGWAQTQGVTVESNLDIYNGDEPPGEPYDRERENELRRRFLGSDCLITLGGDGTLFHAAHVVGDMQIPILSVNLGSLGFHTQFEPQELLMALDMVRDGGVRTQNRLLLQAELSESERSGRPCGPRLALNDIVISRSAWDRMVRLKLSFDGEHVTDIFADGLLVSTPTGSSAYNYAARGPILEPTVEAIVLNAICPHRINFSPIVVSPATSIVVEFNPRKPSEEAQVLVDGRPWCSITHDEKLKISKAAVYLPLIVFRDDFYQKMRDKLRWGGLS